MFLLKRVQNIKKEILCYVSIKQRHSLLSLSDSKIVMSVKKKLFRRNTFKSTKEKLKIIKLKKKHDKPADRKMVADVANQLFILLQSKNPFILQLTCTCALFVQYL